MGSEVPAPRLQPERPYIPEVEVARATRMAQDDTRDQDDVAVAYADVLVCQAVRGHDKVDLTEVNKAIIERWTLAGLERVRAKAWRLASDTTRRMRKGGLLE